MARRFLVFFAAVAACSPRGHAHVDDSDSTSAPDSGDTDTDTNVDDDGDGWSASEDCDDANPEVYPGAVGDCRERLDFDCDGVVDSACEAASFADAIVVDGAPNAVSNLGDVDDDGADDFVVTSGTDFLHPGSYYFAVSGASVGTSSWLYETAFAEIDGTGLQAHGVGDVDGDGVGDLAVPGSGAVYLLTQLSALPAESRAWDAPTLIDGPSNVGATGPLSADGSAYLATAETGSWNTSLLALPLAHGEHDGTSEAAGTITDAVGLDLHAPVDLDGDGLSDLVVLGRVSWIPGAVVFLGGPSVSGTRDAADGDAAWLASGANYIIDGVGDTNGDGLDDIGLAYGEADEFVAIESWAPGTHDLNDAAVVLAGNSRMSGSWATALSGAGDLNEDGRGDVWVETESWDGASYGSVCFYAGTSDGGVYVPEDVDGYCWAGSRMDSPFSVPGINGPFSGTLDIDGDGRNDLVLPGWGDQAVYVFTAQ